VRKNEGKVVCKKERKEKRNTGKRQRERKKER
jgi:hypothetical protein